MNFDGFAGASAEGKLISIVEWCKDLSADFKSLAEFAAIAAGSAGAGAEVKFEVKYDNGKFRIETSVMAVVGIGGKYGGVFELNVDEGIALLAHLFDCVKFHYITAVKSEAFDAYVNVTLGRFLFIGTFADKYLSGFRTWIQTVSNKDYKEAKQVVRKNIGDSSKFKDSPPETLGQLLQVIVKVPEVDDFEAILKVLRSADSIGDEGHKLKWIIRSFHDPDLSKKNVTIREQESKTALEEGIRTLMEFGEDMEGYDEFLEKLHDILTENGIKYDKKNG